MRTSQVTTHLNDLPTIITAKGDYVSRDGKRVTILDVKPQGRDDTTAFSAKGMVWKVMRQKHVPKAFNAWHVSGRLYPLHESASDIIGPWKGCV